MASDPPGEVTQLLQELQRGNADAARRLIPLVYEELRRLAGHHMRDERPDHTLQPTALVHEAYLRLADQDRVEWAGRTHFIAVASTAMRRILLDHARRHRAEKRGGGRKTTLVESLAVAASREIDMLALDDALTRLEARDPRQGRIVELRYFGGLSIEETAAALSISPTTVKREWRFARAWLHRELSDGADDA